MPRRRAVSRSSLGLEHRMQSRIALITAGDWAAQKQTYEVEAPRQRRIGELLTEHKRSEGEPVHEDDVRLGGVSG